VHIFQKLTDVIDARLIRGIYFQHVFPVRTYHFGLRIIGGKRIRVQHPCENACYGRLAASYRTRKQEEMRDAPGRPLGLDHPNEMFLSDQIIQCLGTLRDRENLVLMLVFHGRNKFRIFSK